MKILNIRFKNINSLEGESEVNFEQPPFSDTGVFAITGPNGSGKSSILDVITLGLYGETFRFDRPADYVMTKQTAECFSIVEFSLSGEKYQSSWYVQRAEGKSTRELMLPEMQLVRLSDGQVLANTPYEVCARITEITGMNFRNFTRSIMLAQGDFSAFLNARDSERMDILEKIISTDIYADYKKEIVDNAENAQMELDLLKNNLAAIQLIEHEKQEAAEHDLMDFKDDLLVLQEDQSRLKDQKTLLINNEVIKKKIVEQENNLADTKKQAENTQAILDRIIKGQDALIFKDDISLLKDKNHAIHQDKLVLDEFQDELKQLKNKLGSEKEVPENLELVSFTEQQKTLENINAQLSHFSLSRQSEMERWESLSMQHAEKEAVFTTVSDWLQDHEADAILLTNFPEIGKLKKLRAELTELTGKQKLFSKQSKKTTSSFRKNVSELAKEIKKQADLTKQLEADEQELEVMSKANTSGDIEVVRLDQQERVINLQTLYQLAQKHQKLSSSSGFFSLFRRKDQPDQDEEILNLEFEKLKQELKREENIRRVLEESIARESLLKKMAPDRHSLVDGKPCPLCGALQHPYAKYPPAVSNSKQALIDQKAKLRLIKETSINLGLKISDKQTQSTNNKDKQTQLLQTRAQWLSLCNRLNIVSSELDITNLGLIKELIKKESGELSDIVSFASKYQSKQASVKKIKLLIAKSVIIIDQLQLATQEMGFNNEGLSQEQMDINAALGLTQTQEKELADKLLEQLLLLGEKLPAKGQEDVLFDRLNIRRQDHHGYAFRHKALAEELEDLQAKKMACQNEITFCNERLDFFSDQLQNEESIGLHLGIIEKQKLIAEKERFLTQLEAETYALQQMIQKKMEGTNYTNVQEINELLDLIENQPAIERKKEELEQTMDAMSIELELSYAQLQVDFAIAELANLDITTIEAQLKDITGRLEITSMEVQHLERLLSEQEQLQQTYDEVLLRLQQQELIFQPYFAEMELVTVESGMAFRRRVQQRIADKLLSQTNGILEKISGRYYLRQGVSEQGLALEVEDTYQANVRRLPKTLSGGESFVVSLALALGLSELANNGRSVDSLFLDEGFGNLDADSLYTVISTLENLHTYGKTVGVISHIEAVQKRFKAQLQVVKKPNGMGELKKAS